MMKRQVLGKAVGVLPMSLGRQMRRMHRGEYLTVLCYHRIMDRPDDFPFDDDLVSASAADFDRQMAWVAEHYNVIDFRDLAGHLDREGRFPPRALIVTFDDGYYDNHSVAWPILYKHGLKAVMFVTSGFIGTDRIFWWDRIAWLVKTASPGSYEIPAPAAARIDIGDGRQETAAMLIKHAKRLPDAGKEKMIDVLAEALGAGGSSPPSAQAMTWDQVRELDSAGIEIGAHSVNHPIFSNVDEERIRYEVTESKKMIENEIGRQVISFGAPGRGIIEPAERSRFESVLREIVSAAGYRFSTQYRWGLVYENEFDPYGIERLGIETHDDLAVFRAKLSWPEIVNY